MASQAVARRLGAQPRARNRCYSAMPLLWSGDAPGDVEQHLPACSSPKLMSQFLPSTLPSARRHRGPAALLAAASAVGAIFRNVVAAGAAGDPALALGSAAHAVTCGRSARPRRFRLRHAPLIAIFPDRQCGGVLAVHARAVRRNVQAALGWHAVDVGGGRSLQLRQLHRWIAPASRQRGFRSSPINLLALGFILLAVGANNRLLVGSTSSKAGAASASSSSAPRSTAALNADLADRDLQQMARRTSRMPSTAPCWLAVIVAAICYAMMRVDGAELFAAAPAAHAASEAVGRRSRRGGPESSSTR